jgi:hypothetical protein
MKVFTGFFILLILSSCVKDKPQEPLKTSAFFNSDSRVLVVNEGPFNTSHGSISIYNPQSNDVVEDFYFQQNNSYLGNIVQSICKYNNNYYIVNNNSSSVIVVNASDFVKTATITGFNSPRYMLPVTYNKAYVSDIYANTIHVVNLNTNTISGSIACMHGTEEMALIYNKAFITNTNSDYCYVINTATDVITDSIAVGRGSSSVVVDKNSKVWILTGGNSTLNLVGKLVRIDPITLQIEQSLNFSLLDSPNKLCINKTRDTLYYLNKGVNQINISSTSLPVNPIVNQGSKIYYGLGINPKDYTIYVSDAIDYTQKSKIEIYKPNGSFITNFNAGIISNGFMFE